MQNYEYEYLPGGSSFYYTQVHYPQGHSNYTIHAHQRNELLIIDSPGQIQFVCNSNVHTITTPAAVWLRTGVFHQTAEVSNGDFHCAVIYYHDKLFANLPQQLLHTAFLSGCDMFVLPLSRQQVQELVQLTAPLRTKSEAQFQQILLLLCLFDKLSSFSAHSDQALRIHDAPHYVFRLASQLQDLSSPTPTLEDLSRAYFVGQSKLTADFKNVFGMSILAFRRHIQLQAARVLLESTAMDLSQISDECGFSDDNYFIRVFRKHYGITPGTYRKNMK